MRTCKINSSCGRPHNASQIINYTQHQQNSVNLYSAGSVKRNSFGIIKCVSRKAAREINSNYKVTSFGLGTIPLEKRNLSKFLNVKEYPRFFKQFILHFQDQKLECYLSSKKIKRTFIHKRNKRGQNKCNFTWLKTVSIIRVSFQLVIVCAQCIIHYK